MSGISVITQRCTKCGTTKQAREFRERRDRGRLHSICRACEEVRRKTWLATPEGRASSAWTSMLDRVGNRRGKTPTYANIHVRMTRGEFLAWATPVLAEWMRENPGKTPSLDRIDGHDHYRIGNLRFVTRVENTRTRTSNKNIHAPTGMAWCGICKSYLSQSRFHRESRRANGLSTRCKSCHWKRYQKSRYRWTTPEQKAEIVALRSQGLSLQKIADRIGRSPQCVWKQLKQGAQAS